MKIDKVQVTLSLPTRKDCKRVTVYMDPEHKRFIEEWAHRYRITEFEVLYHILDEAMLKRIHDEQIL